MATVLPEVEAFLKATGMAPTTFGADALGDRHFVRQLRAGRRCWPETEQKVRVFIAGYHSPKDPQSSSPSPALCTTCDHRLDDTSIRACGERDCPHVQKEAA